MCGRYVRRSDKQRLVEHFHTGATVFDIPPSYNIAPTTFQPVIRLDRDTGEREITMMRWGLIPAWCKDVKLLGLSTINAKAESLMLKPMWRQPFKKRRCLVPADAFYEWKKIDAKTKQPYAFGMKDGAPFAFAGVWERWIAPDDKPVDTFAIITTDPNELAANGTHADAGHPGAEGLHAMADPCGRGTASRSTLLTALRCGRNEGMES